MLQEYFMFVQQINLVHVSLRKISNNRIEKTIEVEILITNNVYLSSWFQDFQKNNIKKWHVVLHR